MKTYSYAEIAADWKLWQEYADPSGIETKQGFDSTPTPSRIAFLVGCFGPESPTTDSIPSPATLSQQQPQDSSCGHPDTKASGFGKYADLISAAQLAADLLAKIPAFGDDIGKKVSKAQLGVAHGRLRLALGKLHMAEKGQP